MKRAREDRGPRFKYLEPSDKKAYLDEIGRLLDLDREPAMHAALYFTLRFLKLARGRGLEPHVCLKTLVAEQAQPAKKGPSALEEKLEALTSRLVALESSGRLPAVDGPATLPPVPASAARRMSTARLDAVPQTLTPVTVVAAGGEGSQSKLELVAKAEPKRADYRSCRRTHRTLKF